MPNRPRQARHGGIADSAQGLGDRVSSSSAAGRSFGGRFLRRRECGQETLAFLPKERFQGLRFVDGVALDRAAHGNFQLYRRYEVRGASFPKLIERFSIGWQGSARSTDVDRAVVDAIAFTGSASI